MTSGNWTNGMKTLRFLGFAFTFVCVLMLIAYFTHFNGKFADRSVDWANFGSYFGSITGLMAFLAVLFTAIQSEKRANKAERKTLLAEIEAKEVARLLKQETDRREAKATEEAVRREERDLFFRLLELHQEKLNSVVYEEKKNTKSEIDKHNDLIAIEKYSNILNNLLADYTINDSIRKISFAYLNIVGVTQSNQSYYEKKITSSCLNIHCLISDSNRFNENGDPIGEIRSEYEYVEVQNFLDDNIQNPDLYTVINSNEIFRLLDGINEAYNLTITLNQKYLAMKLVGSILDEKFGHILGQYFKNMEFILKTCDKINYDKEYYFNLYRSQLSRNEILLTLFYAISGKSNPLFVRLLYREKILDEIYYKDLFYTLNINWKGNEKIFIDGILNERLNEIEN